MSPPINLDGDTVDAITIDGTEVTEVTADGEVVFGSAIPDNVIDNFEPSLYQDEGNTIDTYYDVDTSAASLSTSNPAPSGSSTQHLTIDSGTGQNTIVSINDGLPNYPSQGDIIEGWFYNVSQVRLYFFYGRQTDSGGRDNGGGYAIEVNDLGDAILYRDGRGGTTLDSGSITNYSNDQWYRTTIDWQTDGSHTVDIFEPGGSNVLTLSASDSTYTSGGISFTGDNGSAQGTVFFDQWFVL